MPRRKEPINWPLQQAVGCNVRQIRQALRYAQPEFASLLGITRAQLAAIEAGKTALRYRTALRLRELFGEAEGKIADAVELCALAGTPKDLSIPSDAWPPDSDKTIGIGPQTLLSEVAAMVIYDKRSHTSHMRVGGGRPVETTPRFSQGSFRRWIEDAVREVVHQMLAAIPDGSLGRFWCNWQDWADQVHVEVPELPADMARAFFLELATRHSGQSPQAPAAPVVNQEKGLTSEPLKDTTPPVQPVMPTLIERLRRATKEHGRKTELAKWLGVPRQSVNGWLAGDKEPSGETTLRLLHWVEQEDRQPKPKPAAAVASPVPAAG